MPARAEAFAVQPLEEREHGGPTVAGHGRRVSAQRIDEDVVEVQQSIVVARHLIFDQQLGVRDGSEHLDEVSGKRCTFQGFPWKWHEGDACVIRLVAIFDPSGNYRIESGRGS